MISRAMIEERVRAIIGLVVGNAVEQNDTVELHHNVGWDSLGHAEIVFSVEDSFGIMFYEEELPELRTVDALVDAVQRQLERSTGPVNGD
jgi:acyl carrier protein